MERTRVAFAPAGAENRAIRLAARRFLVDGVSVTRGCAEAGQPTSYLMCVTPVLSSRSPSRLPGPKDDVFRHRLLLLRYSLTTDARPRARCPVLRGCSGLRERRLDPIVTK